MFGLSMLGPGNLTLLPEPKLSTLKPRCLQNQNIFNKFYLIHLRKKCASILLFIFEEQLTANFNFPLDLASKNVDCCSFIGIVDRCMYVIFFLYLQFLLLLKYVQ
jgi:hypothetical protein